VARSSPGSCRRRGGPGAGDGHDGGQRNGVKEQGPRWRPARRHEGEGPDGSLCDGAKELAWRARVARAGKGAQGHASRSGRKEKTSSRASPRTRRRWGWEEKFRCLPTIAIRVGGLLE